MFAYNRWLATAICCLTGSFVGCSPGDSAPLPALRAGSDAPPLQVLKWVKGVPVDEFEIGQVYALEFWGSWCRDCLESMPHMTRLAQKFDDRVTFIAVSIRERPEERTDAGILAVVEPFVASQGEAMNYRVAVDGINELMTNTWYHAAGQRGIPCVFVIGRDKKITWIGLPQDLEPVLEQVVASNSPE